MEAAKMKIADMRVPEKNVRIHTEAQIREFEKSVKMFGQLRPIVVDEDGLILAGNGLYLTLKKMGWEEAEVYIMTDLTENQKKKLMIADNKIFSLGIENLETLNEFLEDLNGDFDIPGFDEDVLRQMMADSDEIDSQIQNYGTLDEEEVQSIRHGEERKQERDEARQEEAGQPATVPEQSQGQADGDTRTTNAEATDAGQYVVCPNCGTKIWL